MQKRGLSDIVTTVLIILLVLAAIVIVWRFIRPVLINAGENVNVDQFSTRYEITNTKQSFGNVARGIVSFTVVKKSGPENSLGYYIQLEDSTGKSASVKKTSSEAAIRNFESKPYTMDYYSLGLKDVTAISVKPIFSSGSRELVSDVDFQASIPDPISVKDNLKLYYKFDNDASVGENNKILYDWSGNGKSGTANDDIVHSPTLGKVGGAYTFDGVNDYINVDSGSITTATDPFTISVWFKLDGTLDSWSPTIFAEGYTYKTDGYDTYRVLQISTSGNDDLLFFKDASSSACNIGTTIEKTISRGSWYHVVFVKYGSSSRKLYINGNYLDECTMSIIEESPSPPVLSIGRFGAGGLETSGTHFKGQIDELMVFNRSLTSEEIKDLYESYE